MTSGSSEWKKNLKPVLLLQLPHNERKFNTGSFPLSWAALLFKTICKAGKSDSYQHACFLRSEQHPIVVIISTSLGLVQEGNHISDEASDSAPSHVTWRNTVQERNFLPSWRRRSQAWSSWCPGRSRVQARGTAEAAGRGGRAALLPHSPYRQKKKSEVMGLWTFGIWSPGQRQAKRQA